MTLKAFFTGRAIVFVLLLVGMSVLAYTTYAPAPQHEEATVPSNESAAPPVFAWSFVNDATLNPDGLPRTNVILTATYADGAVENAKIGPVSGGCSVLPDPEEGSLSGTTAIQCYYAGLGQRYRIVMGGTSYLVQRKTFEEASPEYDPPQEAYETVSELPLSN